MPVVDLWHRWETRPDGSKVKVQSAKYGRGRRWAARYRDDAGEQRSPAFGTQEQARAHLREVEADLQRGVYIDPKAGEVKLRDFAEEVIANAGVDEATRDGLRQRLRLHVFPYLGGRKLKAFRPSMIQGWMQNRREVLGDQTVRTVFGNLAMVFQAAVDDGLIGRNPCRSGSVKPPPLVRRKVVPWSVETVAAIQGALPAYCGAVVAPGAGCGLRQGEVFGLAVDDVDFLGKVVSVARQLKFVRSRPVFAPPKGRKEREVPLPDHVAVAMAQHMERFPPVEVTLPWRDPKGDSVTVRLVFTSRQGRHMAKAAFNNRDWKPALVKAGLLPAPAEGEGLGAARDLGFHQLRHHYASVLLDDGVSIRALAEFLGHSDPAFTLRTYAHMMPSNTERARGAVDKVWAQPTDTSVRPVCAAEG